jgi:hypothetical protein
LAPGPPRTIHGNFIPGPALVEAGQVRIWYLNDDRSLFRSTANVGHPRLAQGLFRSVRGAQYLGHLRIENDPSSDRLIGQNRGIHVYESDSRPKPRQDQPPHVRRQHLAVDRIPPAQRLADPPTVDPDPSSFQISNPIRFSSKHAPDPMFTSTAPSLISRAATSGRGTNRASVRRGQSSMGSLRSYATREARWSAPIWSKRWWMASGLSSNPFGQHSAPRSRKNRLK